MNVILAVAAGGAFGATGRYLLGLAAFAVFGSGLPYGTFIANVVGGFLMGVVVETGALKFNYSPELRAFMAVGILGGFTTFSSFSLETALMIERGEWGVAAAYVIGSAVLSIAALFCGLWLMRSVLA